ncbi:uncharacterized protein LOC128132901 [Lactuca sativa]|uniref:uncharacterized protein LOC128132901 n=1 Tax=Lactuca sativa TaxID=4236 RepID=UPI0022AF0539|nr:uncharacterized protein LOC128132901 [Lactuca sativa]
MFHGMPALPSCPVNDDVKIPCQRVDINEEIKVLDIFDDKELLKLAIGRQCMEQVQTIHKPTSPKKFATQQKACQKDVERAFGVLQSRFAIVQGSTCFCKKVSTTCIILHNMIINDEHDLDTPIEIAREVPPIEVELTTDEDSQFQQFLARYKNIKDKEAHFSLRNALVDHLWEIYSNA